MNRNGKLMAIVDDLGRVKARIAELEEQERILREKLVECGLECVEGRLFRASISTSTVHRTDWHAIVEELHPSKRRLEPLLKEYTDKNERTVVKVTAR